MTPSPADLDEVPDPAQQPVGDPGRAPRRARRSAAAPVGLDRDAEDPGRAAPRCASRSSSVVEVEPADEPEAVPQRARHEPGPGRRADEGEARQVEADRARGRALADHDVELGVLHRRVEDLLDRAVQPVDLVDEEDVALLEVGEERGEVAGPGEHRSRGDAQARRPSRRRRCRRARSCRARAGRRRAGGRPAARAARRPRARSRGARPAGAWPTNSARVRGRRPASSASSAASGDRVDRRACRVLGRGPRAGPTSVIGAASSRSAPRRSVLDGLLGVVGRQPLERAADLVGAVAELGRGRPAPRPAHRRPATSPRSARRRRSRAARAGSSARSAAVRRSCARRRAPRTAASTSSSSERGDRAAGDERARGWPARAPGPTPCAPSSASKQSPLVVRGRSRRGRSRPRGRGCARRGERRRPSRPSADSGRASSTVTR